MDKIKGDTFVDVYLIGSIQSLNIRVDHRDKKSLNVIKKNIARLYNNKGNKKWQKEF